jgi:phosphinothricin acetyltransferase
MHTIRLSREEEVSTIPAIYRHHVLHGTGTFEIDPPSEAEMAVRRSDVLAKN